MLASVKQDLKCIQNRSKQILILMDLSVSVSRTQNYRIVPTTDPCHPRNSKRAGDFEKSIIHQKSAVHASNLLGVWVSALPPWLPPLRKVRSSQNKDNCSCYPVTLTYFWDVSGNICGGISHRCTRIYICSVLIWNLLYIFFWFDFL